MKKEKVVLEEKECRRCHNVKKIEEFRSRPNGFTLNQCRECESELGSIRREDKKTQVSPIVEITTKSGKVVQASMQPIVGGRMTTSPLTDKVLYFDANVSRDVARVAFSAYADVVRTGISYQPVQM